MKRTKILLLWALLLPTFSLHAKDYVFSGGEHSLIQSISAVVLVRAYKKAGIKIIPVFLELQHSLQQSNAGITDGEIARVAGINIFTPNLRKVPVPITSLDAVAFSKNTALKIDNWNGLASHHFTIVKGVKYIETATKQYKPNHAISFDQASELLQAGKTEIVVASKVAFMNMLYKKGYSDIKAISGSLKKLELFHFVHKKNQHLIPVITPVLQHMLDSGEISHIRNYELIKAAKKFSEKLSAQ